MSVSFSLLQEPWIPVMQDGYRIEMNLSDVLLQAHELEGISDPIPVVEFGLYRFLVALVMDVYQLNDTEDLERLLEDGCFGRDALDSYFGLWGDRFDLFHQDYPFLQTVGIDDSPDKPLAGLLPSVPSGTAVNHFHHRSEKDFAVSPGVAARLLTSVSPFMTAGGAGLSPSINGAPPWYLLLNGRNLFETICLNCCVIPLAKELSGSAPPAWRNPEAPKNDRCTKASLLEAFTWRPRRIRLIPGQQGTCSITGLESPVVIRSMKFLAGASCDFTWRDPSVPYRITDKGPVVLRPQEGREVWRDTGAFMLLQDRDFKTDDKFRIVRPTLVDQFAKLVADRVVDRDTPFSVTVYGMRTDLKMKVFEWQKERLSVPVPVVLNAPFHVMAQESMDKAESVEYAIKKAIRKLYPRDGAGNDSAMETVISTARREYWADLREDYSILLEQMASVPPGEEGQTKSEIKSEWQRKVKGAALAVFDRASGDLDTDSDAIRRQVESRQDLMNALYWVFETPENKQAKKRKEGKSGNGHRTANITTAGADASTAR